MFDSFHDELAKLASVAGRAAAAAGSFATHAAMDPFIRAEVKSFVRGGGSIKGSRAVSEARPLPPGAVKDAKRIADTLRRSGFDPKKSSIGMSGTGGTGKSTMAKALSVELGMHRVQMDKELPSEQRLRHFDKKLRAVKVKPGSIVEQTHLLNHVDPDKFDAVIRLYKPPAAIKKQLLGRGRGAVQWSIFDYPKLHAAIKKGVEATKGDSLHPTPGVEMKLKPEGGFQADKMLNRELRQKGINPGGLTRQQKILSAVQGVRDKRYSGQMAFVRKETFLGAARSAGVGAIKGTKSGMRSAVGAHVKERIRDRLRGQ